MDKLSDTMVTDYKSVIVVNGQEARYVELDSVVEFTRNTVAQLLTMVLALLFKS